MRRVVVTGVGLVTPLGSDVESSWSNLLAGRSAVEEISRFDTENVPCKIAAEVDCGDGEGQFNAQDWIPKKELRTMDTFIQYGIAASIQAVEDAGWKPEDEESRMRTGVQLGSGIGGLPEIERMGKVVTEKSAKRIGPFFIPATLVNLTSGHVSIKYGFRGPNHSAVTACSTGVHAITDAARLIMCDEADVMVAGSSEATICELAVGGFSAARALSTAYNDDPTAGSRPWDKGRDGFVMGEGAGVVVLEEYEHAKKRGAKIYGEVAGFGLSGDAYHITSPHPEGRGGYDAMNVAMKHAKLNADDMDYINAHGTSTPMGDLIELNAVKRLFGNAMDNISMSSTKSAIGHLLGGAGSVESIFSLLAMRDNVVPPTLNLDDPEEDTKGVDLVPHEAKERKVDVALSNSFGFGGTNASVIFKRCS